VKRVMTADSVVIKDCKRCSERLSFLLIVCRAMEESRPNIISKIWGMVAVLV
jgi:hypothetical protein